MDVAGKRQPRTLRLRRLGARLRALRDAKELTREQVTERTGVNSVTLYRIEAAKARPQQRTLVALLDFYGVTQEPERGYLINLAKDSKQLAWLKTYERELPEEYTDYISLEIEADSVRNYESLFVPGLLQTDAYARAVIRGVLPMADDEQIESRIQARMRRVEWFRQSSLNLSAIIDEAVIMRRVGGSQVMAQQLGALIEATKLPQVTLQVIPFEAGAHAGMPGSFVVMNFPDSADRPVVYLDSMGGDLFLEGEMDVRRYNTLFERLQAASLPMPDSLRRIEKQADALRKEGGCGTVNAPELGDVTWRKSSRSSGNGQCVEVASYRAGIAVRDSKDPAGPALLLSAVAWNSFLATIR